MPPQPASNSRSFNLSGPLFTKIRTPKGLLALLAAAIASSSAQATTLTWDSSGSNPAAPVGNSGTWSSSNANWSNGVMDSVWNNANNDSAVINWINSESATITLGENITANSLTFGGGGNFTYQIAGGGNTLTVTSGTITTSRATDVLANIAGSDGLTKAGSATLRLFTAASYTGNTSVQAGNLQIRTANALPTTTAVSVSTGATLDVRANQTISGLSGGGTIAQTGGSGTLTVNSSEASTFSGIIQQTVALVKEGSQSLTLAGANTYTGLTTVNAGSLLIASGGSLASAVTVNAGTLGGVGSTSNTVAIGDGSGTSDAIVAPGTNGIGTFTTSNALSLNSDAVFAFELNGTTAMADRLVANGVTVNSSAEFSFTLLGDLSGLAVNDQFTIIDNTAGGNISGTFSNLAAGGSYNAGGGLVFGVSGGSGSYGNDLVLTVVAVPEPSAALLLAFGLTCLVLRRKARALNHR